MLNVVFLDALHYPNNYQLKKLDFEHNWISYPYTLPEQTFERSKEADIIISSKVVLDRPTLERLAEIGRLKLIQIPATGTNNVDLEAAKELGIAVQNVEGYSSNSVAEHVIGFIFNLSRSYHGWSRDQLQARWSEQKCFTYYDYPIFDIAGKTLTIVGRGNIGNLVAEKAKALGMKVIFAERHNAEEVRPGYVEFKTAIAQADYITLHCPLTPSTVELVNQDFINLMKKTAFLINTGRGGLINEAVLAQALKERRIAGAALDVLSTEPPAKDNPLVLAGLDEYNLFITPHNAFASEQSLRKLADLMVDHINTFVKNNY
ncbi:glycerate dehydrogenase [Psittacicella hinzii]|uniref:Glycerate dehydrogenase n=1 Tax=Psittacicella hinzii TaxID=2028575 RepID=A0A3A1Y3A4_9GAMM|nr:D-2-hydroxyacid dehydrogenase [Psittacicella hinzii]RIY32045.1 glycerate dehydrogenase [Psittacicella hinzii]